MPHPLVNQPSPQIAWTQPTNSRSGEQLLSGTALSFLTAVATALNGNLTPNGIAQIKLGNSITISAGRMTPNGNLAGNVGDIYIYLAGGASQTLWIKESGVGTPAGWISK